MTCTHRDDFSNEEEFYIFDYHKDFIENDFDSNDCCVLLYSELHDNLDRRTVSNAAYLKTKKEKAHIFFLFSFLQNVRFIRVPGSFHEVLVRVKVPHFGY